MNGLLSGLDGFGLGNLENMELYEKPKAKEAGGAGAAAAAPPPPVVQEQDFLFDKVLPARFVTMSLSPGR